MDDLPELPRASRPLSSSGTSLNPPTFAGFSFLTLLVHTVFHFVSAVSNGVTLLWQFYDAGFSIRELFYMYQYLTIIGLSMQTAYCILALVMDFYLLVGLIHPLLHKPYWKLVIIRDFFFTLLFPLGTIIGIFFWALVYPSISSDSSYPFWLMFQEHSTPWAIIWVETFLVPHVFGSALMEISFCMTFGIGYLAWNFGWYAVTNDWAYPFQEYLGDHFVIGVGAYAVLLLVFLAFYYIGRIITHVMWRSIWTGFGYVRSDERDPDGAFRPLQNTEEDGTV
eukprot:TRINITY_DN13427_c0_g1_i1.p1 TRINITY_DN13427_c0_g1~~TRINITY_DN13427_c0_g1_i1.p1  ORF type:complete len:280 (-),score=54.47 TRINITY_DN13427_c0_g1_i1:71-910(-)